MNTAQAAQVDSFDFSMTDKLVNAAVAERILPGGVLLVGYHDRIVCHKAFGEMRYRDNGESVEAIDKQTIFDLDRLTASLVTTSLLMHFVQSGRIGLDERLTRYIDGFGIFGKSVVTIRHALANTSGLPASFPFFELFEQPNSSRKGRILTSRSATEHVMHKINEFSLKARPGVVQSFSEVGFLILGRLIEVLSGYTLSQVAHKALFRPLGLRQTGFIDLSLLHQGKLEPVAGLIAPTLDCGWRDREICGEVKDENCWAMGGVSGVSGLFSSAIDVHLLCRELIAGYHDQSPMFSKETVREFWRADSEFPDGWRLGWGSPESIFGLADPGESVAMSGETGSSIWIDPDRALHVIFLSNASYPARLTKKFNAFLPKLYSSCWKALQVGA